MPFETQLLVEGLSAWRAADKLNRAGIPVLSVQKTQKNAVLIRLKSKDLKKGFAILRGSCYNVKRVRRLGLSRLFDLCKKRAGVFAGITLFALIIPFAESRVLRIEVTGSGACYRAEAHAALQRAGVSLCGAFPADTADIEAEILALPRVTFCTIACKGGIVTVEIEVNDENAALEGKPLLSPATGVVEELTVVRGTALVAVGDAVNAGDIAVENATLVGEQKRPAVVIARIKVAYAFSAEYPVEEESAAIAQAVFDAGELADVRTEKTENGWLVQGTANKISAMNLE